MFSPVSRSARCLDLFVQAFQVLIGQDWIREEVAKKGARNERIMKKSLEANSSTYAYALKEWCIRTLQHRFKSPFHQNFFNTFVASKAIIQDATFNLQEVRYPQIVQQIDLRGWKRLNKPKNKISQSIIQKFYSNARVDPDTESGPRFHTFVRGVLMNFSYEKVKQVMKFKGPLNTEMSYKTRMIPANLDPDAIIRDLCVEGAVWELGAQNNPRILKRTDLIPIAKC
ncbi:hypothetical protein PIB30_098893 [Stylosanthes scabra]|uniref:Uncharacterized protein n=1 Tax=Stylosanthes scabra TaxID=79078 RepID=A0ABU6WUW9_9FABA|nr:hypothetical protein [Stylosanthes scabra]